MIYIYIYIFARMEERGLCKNMLPDILSSRTPFCDVLVKRGPTTETI